jgi:hypothetical protein
LFPVCEWRAFDSFQMYNVYMHALVKKLYKNKIFRCFVMLLLSIRLLLFLYICEHVMIQNVSETYSFFSIFLLSRDILPQRWTDFALFSDRKSQRLIATVQISITYCEKINFCTYIKMSGYRTSFTFSLIRFTVSYHFRNICAQLYGRIISTRMF